MESLRNGNKELIKDINKAKVIDQIRSNSPISRTDIAKNISLGLSTVTKIIAELEQQGLVSEIGEGESNGGRKPIFLEFNHDYGYIIGIKIETEQIIMALRNLNIELVEKLIIQYPSGADWHLVLDQMMQGIEKLRVKSDQLGKKILGVGIGISGVVDIKRGVLLYSPMLHWEEVPFAAILEREFQIPVSVDNDVNTYTLAELEYGLGKKLENFICVSIGVGIGAGIIMNHQLYRGDFGGAGEFGHFIIKMDGKPCYCGQKGCLERYAGNRFILEKTKELLDKSGDVHSTLYDNRENMNIDDILKAAQNGDAHARQAYHEVGKNLGIGLANIINIFNPAAVILTGEGIAARPFIEDQIVKYAGRNYFTTHKKCPILFSKLGSSGWEIGAATAAVINLFEEPIYQNARSPLL